MTPPDLDRSYALFLDLDGTLLEIAPTPELVVVPPGLVSLLASLHALLGGALAIVSGRPLQQIDTLLDPFRSSAAGEHGATVRYDDGVLEEARHDGVVPRLWRESLAAAAEHLPGVRVEDKPHGVTVHYRLAPELGENVWRLTRALVPHDHPKFRLLPAREAVEIGVRGTNKGNAVRKLMEQAAFRGRRPVFVGDDVTDEAGMEAARELGGIGLRVGDVFDGEPLRVRGWLKVNAERLASHPLKPAPTGVPL